MSRGASLPPLRWSREVALGRLSLHRQVSRRQIPDEDGPPRIPRSCGAPRCCINRRNQLFISQDVPLLHAPATRPVAISALRSADSSSRASAVKAAAGGIPLYDEPKTLIFDDEPAAIGNKSEEGVSS